VFALTEGENTVSHRPTRSAGIVSQLPTLKVLLSAPVLAVVQELWMLAVELYGYSVHIVEVNAPETVVLVQLPPRLPPTSESGTPASAPPPPQPFRMSASQIVAAVPMILN
jgi:hypothetical protein